MTIKLNLVITLAVVLSFSAVNHLHAQSRGVGETPINRALPEPVRIGAKKDDRTKNVRFTFEKMKVGEMAINWKTDNKEGLWTIGNALNSPSGVTYFQFESKDTRGTCLMDADHHQFDFPKIEVKMMFNHAKSSGGILWSGKREGEFFSASIDRQNNRIKVIRTFKGKDQVMGTVAIPKSKTRWHKLGVSLQEDKLTVLFNGSPCAVFYDVKGARDHKIGLIGTGSVRFDNYDVRF